MFQRIRRLKELTVQDQDLLRGGEKESLECPNCGSKKFWKDGFRSLNKGKKQRYQCKKCKTRFSIRKKPSITSEERYLRRVCATKDGAKNLIVADIEKEATGDNSANDVFVRYQEYLLKKGLRPSTIKGKVSALKAMKKRGAELYDTESVLETIARADVSEGRKKLYVYAYENFLEMYRGYWQRPIYKRKRKSVFIPKEEEIDILIHGTGKKTSLLLLLLKETGIRADESTQVQWDDIDFEAGTINITPSKDGNPRKLPLSNTIISRLHYIRRNNRTKDPRRVFAKDTDSLRRVFNIQRKRMAEEYQNIRLERITFHTFRHWKGTTMIHLGYSLTDVQYVLGHKSLTSTMMYIHLAEAHYNEGAKRYTVKDVRKVEEAIPLIAEGYEKADEIDGVHIYKKQLL